MTFLTFLREHIARPK